MADTKITKNNVLSITIFIIIIIIIIIFSFSFRITLFAYTLIIGPLKQKFSSIIRAILRKLIKRVPDGEPYEEVKSMIPEEDMALLEYIERHGRRAMRRKIDSLSQAERLLGSDSEDESDDEEVESGYGVDGKFGVLEDYRLGARPRAVRTAVSITGGGNIETESVEDALPERRRRVRVKRNIEGRSVAKDLQEIEKQDKEDEDYEVSISETGQVVLTKKSEVGIMPQNLASAVNTLGSAEGVDAGAANRGGSTSKTKAEKQNGTKRGRTRDIGEEYRSKRAGGDVWRSGTLQPHAYVSLDPRLLSKKNTDQAVSQFATVIKAGASGKQKREMAQGMPLMGFAQIFFCIVLYCIV